MNLNITIGPVLALIAGIIILVLPKLLNYIVAVYLFAVCFYHDAHLSVKGAGQGYTCGREPALFYTYPPAIKQKP